MSIYRHYLETAVNLIAAYKGDLPFNLYLRHFFAGHRKYGSRDRKQVSALCYNYFRFGHAFQELSTEDKIIAALYLTQSEPSKLLGTLNTVFNENVKLTFEKKLANGGLMFQWMDIFPSGYLLSNAINAEIFCRSMLQQPDVFVRARPGKLELIEKQLAKLGWQFNRESSTCLRLNNGLPIEKNFDLNSELVVQDKNSQKVGDIIKAVFDSNKFYPTEMWDCCAASGGKSIMMHDLFKGIQLTVSDIRETILKNLDTRFSQAGITAKHRFVADLTSRNIKLPLKSSSFILADVPCSGSGTWARTPEQLYFFRDSIAEEYALKQRAIVSNAVKYLAKDGWLTYITCSVFEKENEAIISMLVKEHGLNLVTQQVLDGTNDKCDSMFVAILRANS